MEPVSTEPANWRDEDDASSGAFQSGAFQSGAFQIGSNGTVWVPVENDVSN